MLAGVSGVWSMDFTDPDGVPRKLTAFSTWSINSEEERLTRVHEMRRAFERLGCEIQNIQRIELSSMDVSDPPVVVAAAAKLRCIK